MSGSSTLKIILRRAGPPALALIVMAFFGGYAVVGPNGMFAYGDYKRELAAREAVYAKLDKQRTVLKNRVALLDPKHTNPDMAEELVRKQLKLAHPDEVIVPLN
ncbi:MULTISPECIES: septum formation initiator family protein [unclassified Sphingomonas]|uniref:FtsB family cell division protein n=1 Tax=unclassified Sphingomonas TaxID=196159 RepID=UPI000B322C1C